MLSPFSILPIINLHLDDVYSMINEAYMAPLKLKFMDLVYYRHNLSKHLIYECGICGNLTEAFE